MENLKLIFLYCFSRVLIVICSVAFVVLSIPWFLVGLLKKKVIFEEPDCIKNPKIGKHAYLELKHHDLKIHYVFNGEREKPLMLFVHGFPEFWYTWKYQLPEFGKDHFAVAIDLIGYGKSSKPDGVEPYKPKAIAMYIKDFVHELGYDDCVLVGHDWGGGLAYETAAEYPEIVKKLINISGFPTDMKAIKKLFSRYPLGAAYMFFYQMPYYPEILLSSGNFRILDMLREGKGALYDQSKMTDEDLNGYKYQFQQGGFTGPLNIYRNLFTMETFKFKPKFYDMPTLIVWGSADNFLNPDAAAISAELMSNVRIHYAEGGSHWVNVGKPDEVNRTMRKFLEEV